MSGLGFGAGGWSCGPQQSRLDSWWINLPVAWKKRSWEGDCAGEARLWRLIFLRCFDGMAVTLVLARILGKETIVVRIVASRGK